MLSVPEIFQFSSNIGTAKIADTVGTEGHKEFLTRLGLLTRMQTELPEVALPSQPREWKKINSITISFGHGVSTTPLQTAVAGAALVNGGKLIEPTFLPRTREQADQVAKQVLKPGASARVMVYHRHSLRNWIHGGLSHGILRGKLLRMSYDDVLKSVTDGYIARQMREVERARRGEQLELPERLFEEPVA